MIVSKTFHQESILTNFLRKKDIFSVFDIKLDCFIVIVLFFLCYKVRKLNSENQKKQRKKRSLVELAPERNFLSPGLNLIKLLVAYLGA